MDDRAPRIDPTSRRGRKLIDATFRAIAKWRPTCEWGTVVVQPNCAVRIGRLGDVSDRAPADQRTADGRRRESTVPSRKARSAPTRRTDRSNQRAALHQAAQRFCRIRLLKLAFRGLRSTSALASTPTTANASSASSRRTATTTSEPMHDPAETLQAGASGVDAGSACSITQVEAASTGKRMVSALGDASSPDRTRCRRGARGGGGLDAAQSVSGSVPMGDPSTVAFVPSPPPPLILSPLPRSPFPPPPPLLYQAHRTCSTAPLPPTAGGPGPPS
jgi:hypothetical protein